MDERLFAEVLGEAVTVAERESIPYAVMGSVAVATYGRPVHTKDVDLFVRPPDANPLLHRLEEAGFETERVNDQWLYKAYRKGVCVDIVFRSTGGIYLDDAITTRLEDREFHGVKVRTISPTDLLVLLALATDAATPHHWFDAYELINRADIDWTYLLERSAYGPKRVLSLLLYAESAGLIVPKDVIRTLFNRTYGRVA